MHITEWIRCPVCRNRTRLQIQNLAETVVRSLPRAAGYKRIAANMKSKKRPDIINVRKKCPTNFESPVRTVRKDSFLFA